MKPRHYDHPECRAISDVLQRVGDKWTVLVVSQLGEKKMRFNELRRTIGNISQKMLTTTLRDLEQDGFVIRTVYPTVPPKVEYALSPIGRSLVSTLGTLSSWAETHFPEVLSARERFDTDTSA